MQLDKVPVTREVEQGYEHLSWVAFRQWQIKFERQLSPKETLKNAAWTSEFGQKRSFEKLLNLDHITIRVL
jgi:hypothetical protein